ncbi:MAG: DNA translocase FtsK 4TM domain-containing protein, partial [Gammaproteobacteria bacterium]
GAIGAWVADVLFVFFGELAYFFPLILMTAIFRWQRDRPLLSMGYPKILSLGLIILSASLGAGILEMLQPGLGGLLGQILASSLLFKLGKIGSLCFISPLFLISLSLIFDISWFALGASVYGHLNLGIQNLTIHFKALNFRRVFIQLFEKLIEKKIALVAQIEAPERLVSTPLTNTINTRPEELESVQITKKSEILKIEEASTSSPVVSIMPALDLLESAKNIKKLENNSQSRLKNLSQAVEENLEHFGIQVKVLGVHPGPVITRLELELAAGIKSSRITGLAKDLARALSVSSVRVVEVIPGKSCIGLEIPNPEREMVKLREILQSDLYQQNQTQLPLALGKDIAGHPALVDLARMPHLLVAGTTGSGKSVGVNAMLLSLLYHLGADQLRLILVDPKMLELSIYEGIPHLLTPVVTDMKDAHQALKWCVGEMERRYQLMSEQAVRNIMGYNQKLETQKIAHHERLPYIVIIIDEFADMMMVVGKKVEELITRISQKARAAGIHMILATQRPSVDVITGLIKANIPTRIAFQVSSRIDSRTILDQQGAEQLLGHGDMLYLAPGTGIPQRIHWAFVSDEEVQRVVAALKAQGSPAYIEAVCSPSLDGADALEPEDALYQEALAIVLESRKASASYLQRRLKIGYNRAARLIEALEERNIVSTVQSNGNREVLAHA